MLASAPDTIQLHNLLAHRVGSWGYKNCFCLINTGPFELCGGSFPLALSYNCMQSLFFFSPGLIWNLKSLHVSLLPLPSSFCYCNICYVSYPEAQAGRAKSLHTCTHMLASFPAHAHKMRWLEGRTNPNKYLTTGSQRLLVTHLITTNNCLSFKGAHREKVHPQWGWDLPEIIRCHFWGKNWGEKGRLEFIFMALEIVSSWEIPKKHMQINGLLSQECVK